MFEEFFFLLKKTVSQFLLPVPVLLTLFSVGAGLLWFTTRQRAGKLLVTMGLIGLALVSFEPLPQRILGGLEDTYRPYTLRAQGAAGENEPRIEFIVVLGGGHVHEAGMPIASQLGSSTVVRLVEGIRIHLKHPGSKLVVSGAGDGITTAHLMEQLAIDLGVSHADIVAEPRSRDTKDEARLVKEIVGDASFVLVTAASHMPRAMAMFEKQGMSPSPAPVGHRALEKADMNFADLFPSGGAIRKAETVVYEYLGWVWARLRGQI